MDNKVASMDHMDIHCNKNHHMDIHCNKNHHMDIHCNKNHDMDNYRNKIHHVDYVSEPNSNRLLENYNIELRVVDHRNIVIDDFGVRLDCMNCCNPSVLNQHMVFQGNMVGKIHKEYVCLY